MTELQVVGIDPTLLEEFGADGTLEPFAGGEEMSWKSGNIVLKPYQNEEEAIWSADFMNLIKENGFRVARPVKGKHGSWVYRGWTASRFVEGKEDKGRFFEKIEISNTFHKAIEGVGRPSFIDNRYSPYVVAEKMTWGEIPLIWSPQLEEVLSLLVRALKPLQLKNQLIHGDLTGNILFHDVLLPAIIDMTPYWRPARFATAVIIVDSLVWDKVPITTLNDIENTEEMNQLLLRAAIWRIKITDEFNQQNNERSYDFVNSYKPFMKLLLKRLKQ